MLAAGQPCWQLGSRSSFDFFFRFFKLGPVQTALPQIGAGGWQSKSPVRPFNANNSEALSWANGTPDLAMGPTIIRRVLFTTLGEHTYPAALCRWHAAAHRPTPKLFRLRALLGGEAGARGAMPFCLPDPFTDSRRRYPRVGCCHDRMGRTVVVRAKIPAHPSSEGESRSPVHMTVPKHRDAGAKTPREISAAIATSRLFQEKATGFPTWNFLARLIVDSDFFNICGPGGIKPLTMCLIVSLLTDCSPGLCHAYVTGEYHS
jgi:hypothetical protein